MRAGHWKLYLPLEQKRAGLQAQRIESPARLFNLKIDLKEETNVAEMNPGIVNRLTVYAERIRADADKQREIILANAFRDSEVLRGEGDAKSADIYAQAYGKDIDFFTFYRSMNAYQKTFKGKNDMVVLDPDSEYFKYFKSRQ